jgi:hypothetical protein
VARRGFFDENTLWSHNNFAIISLNIGNATKDDNGIEYQIIVTNRFGQASGMTRLNITCNSRSIPP